MNNATRLKRITSEAKRIRKTKPNMKWVDAVRAASKKLSKSRTNPVKKKAAKKVGAVRTVSKKHTDQNRITANIQFGSSNINQFRDRIETEIKSVLKSMENVKNSKYLGTYERKKILARNKKMLVQLRKMLRDANSIINQSLK